MLNTAATSRSARCWMRDWLWAGYVLRIAPTCKCREQAITEWSRQVISIIGCYHNSEALCACHLGSPIATIQINRAKTPSEDQLLHFFSIPTYWKPKSFKKWVGSWETADVTQLRTIDGLLWSPASLAPTYFSCLRKWIHHKPHFHGYDILHRSVKLRKLQNLLHTRVCLDAAMTCMLLQWWEQWCWQFLGNTLSHGHRNPQLGRCHIALSTYHQILKIILISHTICDERTLFHWW